MGVLTQKEKDILSEAFFYEHEYPFIQPTEAEKLGRHSIFWNVEDDS